MVFKGRFFIKFTYINNRYIVTFIFNRELIFSLNFSFIFNYKYSHITNNINKNYLIVFHYLLNITS